MGDHKLHGLRSLLLIAALGLLVVSSGCSGGCGCPEGLYSFGALEPSQVSEVIADNEGNQDFYILDVRSPGEFAGGHLAGAQNLAFGDSFEADIAALDTESLYLVYCGVGGRSAQAVLAMEQLGFDHIYELAGGITNWISQGYPVE